MTSSKLANGHGSASKIRSKVFFRNLFFAAAIACLVVGVVGIFGKNADLGNLEKASIDNALILEATLEIYKGGGRSAALAIREKNGVIFTTCYIGYCGYNGDHEDLGMPARVWILEGRVAQIEVGGKLKLTKNEVVSRISNRSMQYVFLILSPFFFVFGLNLNQQLKQAKA